MQANTQLSRRALLSGLMLGRHGSYYNFPDPGLINHGWAYWGSNLPRLFQVKARYGPDLVFTPPRNQGIWP